MRTYDVAIIGGGLVGCATAYYLARSGSRVALIERGNLNQGASGQNAGSLHFQLEQRLIQHREELAGELEYYVALTQLAIGHWREIEQELGVPLDLAMHGGLMLAETPAEMTLLQQKAEIESKQGLKVELFDRAQTLATAPYLSQNIAGALFCPDEGHCNPRLLTPAYARQAQQHGTDIFCNARVTAIQRRERQWCLDLSDRHNGQPGEPLCADILLNAAGAWAGEIATMANLHLPIFPVGLLMNVTEKTGPFIRHLIQHVGRKLSMKQVEDGNLLIGGGWPAHLQQQRGRWLSDSSPLIDPDTVRNNLETAAAIAPVVKGLHLLRSWTGTTAITPDQLPILGEVSRAPGFYVAAGGSGFTYGPTYARLMSELITTGGTSFPIAAYSPDRFGHINQFMI